MLPRSLLRYALSALIAFVLVVVASRDARAQTIAILGTPPSTLARVDTTGNSVQKRDQSHYPDGISYSDCFTNLGVQFPLQVTGFNASQVIQVWAGNGTVDCTNDQARTTINQTGCWQALASTVPLQTLPVVNVRIQDIVNVPTPSAPRSGYSAGTSATCGVVGNTSLTVYFLLLNGVNTVSSVTQAFTVQTIGPAAPLGVTATPGDTRVEVNWNSVSGVEGGSVTSATQINVFYQQQGPFSTSADAGTTTTCADGGFTDGGVDDAGNPILGTHVDGGCTTKAGGAPAAACSAPGFDPNGKLPPDPSVQYVTVTLPGSNAVIPGLTDGTSYAVAVAGVDAYYNVGPVSPLQCVSPVKLNDFFQTYRGDGGQGGGGFCSLEAVGMPGDTATFIVASIATCIGFARRRRRGAPARGRKRRDA